MSSVNRPGHSKKLIKDFEGKSKTTSGDGRKTILIVFAHPDKDKSFNGALLNTATTTLRSQGHRVLVSDLFAMKFQPLATSKDVVGYEDNGTPFKYPVATGEAVKNGKLAPDIMSELKKLDAADLVIFQFPMYWFSFPAVMKGWIDRVFVFNYVYGGDLGFYGTAKYKGKKAMLSFTTGGPENMYSPRGINGDMDVLLWHMQNSLNFCNMDVLQPEISYSVAHLSDDQRAELLSTYADRLRNIFSERPVKFITMDKFSDNMQIPADKIGSKGPTIGQHGGKGVSDGSMSVAE